MQQVIFLLVAAVIGVGLIKLRSDAARQRKAVLARLALERDERGDYSPTAELFREAGVPLDHTASLLANTPVPPPPPATAAVPAPDRSDETGVEAAADASVGQVKVQQATGDIRQLYRGISMPAGLVPFGPLAPQGASFVTDAMATVVRAGLEAELERLGCTTYWAEPTVAHTERDGARGVITIYPTPVSATDLDGTPLFPGVGAAQVVVRMVAV